MSEREKVTEYLRRASDGSLAIFKTKHEETAVLVVRGNIDGVRLGCFHGTPTLYMTLSPKVVDTIAALHAAGRFPHQLAAQAAAGKEGGAG